MRKRKNLIIFYVNEDEFQLIEKKRKSLVSVHVVTTYAR